MNKTKSALLEHAELLIRTKGYSAFSYADLSVHVGIKKASIHHYFPTKEMLGIELITIYLGHFSERLNSIEISNLNIRDKLVAYRAFFTRSYDENILPLCCAMAAERATLPPSLQKLSRKLFVIQLDWLTRIINEAELHDEKTSSSIAVMIISALEGASLISWVFNDRDPILSVFDDVLNNHFPNKN